MKLLTIAGTILVLIIASSCTYHSHPQTAGLPPGQAKKVYGTKSARTFAPGQQKKQ